MTVSLRSRLFLLVCSLPLLRLQFVKWLQRTRWELRFAVAAITCWLAMAFGRFITELPAGWFDAVGAQLLTVPGAWVTFMLLMIATASFGLGVLSATAARTLF